MVDSRLCDLCRGITAEALVSQHGYAHASRPEDLGNRGPIGCDLCEELGHDYVPDWDPDDDIDPDGNSGFSKWNLRLGVVTKDPEVCHLKLTSEIWPGPAEEWRQDMDQHYLMTLRGDPAAQYGIPEMNADLTNTRSAETFAFIKSCLHQCNRTHDCSSPLELDPLEVRKRKRDDTGTLAPARLIALNNKDETTISLVQVSERNCPKYMTLSHCWGSNMPEDCLTKKSNIDERLKPFPIPQLPPTFRDAIEITQRLDIQHLWIDTLCIIQDSQEDWAAESVKMGSIYQNSVLNIAAAQAEDSFGGCFNKQSVSRVHDSTIQRRGSDNIMIQGTDSHGNETNLILYRPPYEDIPNLIKESPLNKRGWIFQERVLSPRTVHFTSSQVFWECRTEYWSEDRIPWRAHGARYRPMSSILRPDLEDHTKSARTQFTHERKAARITDHWYDFLVAERFSVRNFTQPSDRLVALAGIATVYKQLTKDKYMAGQWASALAIGLTWNKSNLPRDKRNLTDARRWPTWSWASQDDPVQFLTVGTHPQEVVPDPEFKLIEAKLEYGPGHVNEFSPVIGGFITVQGCLVDLVCEKSLCKYPQGWQPGWEGRYSLDRKSGTGNVRRTLTALAVGRKASSSGGDRFLLLEPCQGKDSSYTRIGIAQVDYPPHMARGGWKDTTKEAMEVRAARSPVTIHLY